MDPYVCTLPFLLVITGSFLVFWFEVKIGKESRISSTYQKPYQALTIYKYVYNYIFNWVLLAFSYIIVNNL